MRGGGSVFRTSWGWAAAEWSDEGLKVLVLPVRSREDAARRLEKFCSVARPRAVWLELEYQLNEYFEGRLRSFSLPLSLHPPGEFTAAVWEAAREIPFGRTSTYGEIARRVGSPGGARAVGRSLGSNPVPLFVPCHRIVAAGGAGGFTGGGGVTMKLRLLRHERIAAGGREKGPRAGRKRRKG